MTFEPSDEKGGTYSYVGEIAGFSLAGGEEYAVEFEDGVPTGIHGWGQGSVTGGGINQSGYGEEYYSLTVNDEFPAECADG
ncbi:MAG: hypothetical protein U1E32_03300 [Rhodoglobus sp.]|nr:hypothetical protein [Rhodoglobus sp.]